MKGSIRQRSKGSWQLRYDITDPVTGDRKYKSETVQGTKREAERVLRERLSAIENGGYVERNRETVGGFMNSWLEGYVASHTSPRTLQGYRQKVRAYIVPCLGGIKLQAIASRHVLDLHKWMLDRGLSNQSVVHAHRILSKALNDATEWGLIPRNPAKPKSVSPPRAQPKEVGVWDIPTLKKFLSEAQQSVFSDVFKLAVYTGMRRSELTGLCWSGIDFDTWTLRVTGTLQRIVGQGLVSGRPKTNTSRRAIAIGETAVQLLHSIRGKQLALQAELGDMYNNSRGYVFTDSLGNPIDADRLTKEFAKVTKRAAISGASFHSLRHCHASLLLAEGVNIKAISERLGHSDVRLTLQTYSHLLPGLQASAADALDRKLSEE